MSEYGSGLIALPSLWMESLSCLPTQHAFLACSQFVLIQSWPGYRLPEDLVTTTGDNTSLHGVLLTAEFPGLA